MRAVSRADGTRVRSRPRRRRPGPTRSPLPPAPVPTVGELPTSSAGAPLVSRVPTTDRVVFVTIDDGLVQDPAVVELVRRMRIPVTLFLVRDFAQQGQAYFQQFVDLGGLVEAHTVKHPDLTTLSAERQYTEICGPLDAFEGLFGRRPVLFRPPGGAYNSTTQSIAASCGYQYVVNWTAAANDGRIDWQAASMQPGDIVLFHFRDDLVAEPRAARHAVQAAGLHRRPPRGLPRSGVGSLASRSTNDPIVSSRHILGGRT